MLSVAGNGNSSSGIKNEYDKLSEHIGLLPLVMVSPADSELIQGGSEERRRFLDVIISQQDKPYLHALIQYNKALLQRNSLLKDQCIDASLYEVLGNAAGHVRPDGVREAADVGE